MRRLRLPRPETILRRLNREIRREQRIRSAAARSGDDHLFLPAEGVRRLCEAEERVKVLQRFRASAFGIPLRPYHATKPLFPKGDRS